jgi:hypothetical protein
MGRIAGAIRQRQLSGIGQSQLSELISAKYIGELIYEDESQTSSCGAQPMEVWRMDLFRHRLGFLYRWIARYRTNDAFRASKS